MIGQVAYLLYAPTGDFTFKEIVMSKLMRVIRTVMVLIVSVLLFSANVNPAQAETGDLTGEWLGTWTSLNAPKYNGTLEMTVTQEGTIVSGTSILGNTKCSPERFFKGQLFGKYDNFIALQLYDDTQTPLTKLWGAINRSRNAISAVYNFDTDTSECYGDVGTMIISKVQDYSQIQGVIKK